MAKYKIEFAGNQITKTLTFRKENFTEEWTVEENGNWETPCELSAKIDQKFPDLPEDIWEIIEEFTCLDEDELVEAFEKLAEYEMLTGEELRNE